MIAKKSLNVGGPVCVCVCACVSGSVAGRPWLNVLSDAACQRDICSPTGGRDADSEGAIELTVGVKERLG